MINNTLLDALIEFNQLNEHQIYELHTPPKLVFSEHPLFSKANKLIREAIVKKRKMIVCGDYDADGIIATTIMVQTLRKLGADVGYYIPNRFTEGYGLNVATVEKALDKGYSFFICVDNGVSAHAALKLLNEHSAISLILDHHQIEQEVDCTHLIHPDMLDGFDQNMCGSGLSFQLSHHLIGFDAYLCSLAAIATIADVMPLWGFNRACVMAGIELINQNSYETLKPLFNKTGLINEQDIAFQLVPKINAFGRLADQVNVNQLVEYLSLEHPYTIQTFAKEMLRINDRRKEINQTMYIEALSLIDEADVQVLSSPQFHEGIVGITAGRLASELRKPVFVLNEHQGRLKGSARSYGGIDLRSLIEPAAHLLLRYGGHAAAAGIELKKEDENEFKRLINEHVLTLDVSEDRDDGLVMRMEWFDIDVIEDCMRFRPFGHGFVWPEFYFKDVEIRDVQRMRMGLRFKLMIFGRMVDAVSFDDTMNETHLPVFNSIKAQVSIDDYRSRRQLKLLIKSFEER